MMNVYIVISKKTGASTSIRAESASWTANLWVSELYSAGWAALVGATVYGAETNQRTARISSSCPLFAVLTLNRDFSTSAGWKQKMFSLISL